MKLLSMLGGAALVSGLLVKTSYATRELMASLVIFSVGFAALLLLLVICFLGIRALAGIVFWVRMRSPLWNRAINDWIFTFRQSVRGIAQHWPQTLTRNEQLFIIEPPPLLVSPAMVPGEDAEILV
jgi:hypothetical protein